MEAKQADLFLGSPDMLSATHLQEISERIGQAFDPERIILFGSYAQGCPTEDSDVDLLVIVPQSDSPPAQRAMQAYRCMRGLNIAKDILVKTRAEVERARRVRASLVSEILERGRVLYG